MAEGGGDHREEAGTVVRDHAELDVGIALRQDADARRLLHGLLREEGMVDDLARLVRVEVPLGESRDEVLEVVAVLVTAFLPEREHLVLHRLGARGAVRRRTRQVPLGGHVQLVEHAPLPARHRAGAGRRHVSEGQQIELAQPFPAPDVVRELLQRTGVVDVPSRGDVVHAKVLQHVVLHLDDVGVGHGEALEDHARELRSALGMMPTAEVLADVV